ncbi:hypothetical protein CRG98_030566 [Punica granatum]|uniref:Uncharacterized protein n=1 Tax=Punica granatum TaxID=22663 RepID=A0A2I0IZ81_PUNGR|nr:hypothetical protein CRG98_030566 [Punica granatum]
MKLLRRCSAPGVAICLICRKPALLLGRLLVALPGKRKCLRRMLFSFGSPGRPVESFCFGDANGGPAFRGPDARPPGLLLALHGHIETFSKMPKRLYRLFDEPVNLGPFSSRTEAESSKCRTRAPCGAEAQKWGQSPMQGRNPKVNAGPEADVRSKPNVVNTGPEPDARPKPDEINAGPEPDVGSKPDEINAGSEPDAGLKPYAINAGPKPDVGSKPNC